MSDMNETIAKFKGSVLLLDAVIYAEKVKRGDKNTISPAPDYQGDPRLYMALFEEMVNENKDCHAEIFWNPGKSTFVCWIIEDLEESGPRDFIAESDTMGFAICKAYIKLHGLECEE
jgi:hypothetical protein